MACDKENEKIKITELKLLEYRLDYEIKIKKRNKSEGNHGDCRYGMEIGYRC